MSIFLRSTKALIKEIDEFLDAVSEGGLTFDQGVQDYLRARHESFEERLAAVRRLESRADGLRRSVENQLYSHTLIPEHRGDVLALLETLDEVVDDAKRTLVRLSVERPEIPADMSEDYGELAGLAAKSGEAVVLAVRSFFRDANRVKDHLHKVYHYEKEADRTAERLLRRIFGEELGLERKMQLRDFVGVMASLSDKAQAVADRLAIYTIKRTV